MKWNLILFGGVGTGRALFGIRRFSFFRNSVCLFAYRNILNGEIHVASLTGSFIIGTPPLQFQSPVHMR